MMKTVVKLLIYARMTDGISSVGTAERIAAGDSLIIAIGAVGAYLRIFLASWLDNTDSASDRPIVPPMNWIGQLLALYSS